MAKEVVWGHIGLLLHEELCTFHFSLVPALFECFVSLIMVNCVSVQGIQRSALNP